VRAPSAAADLQLQRAVAAPWWWCLEIVLENVHRGGGDSKFNPWMAPWVRPATIGR